MLLQLSPFHVVPPFPTAISHLSSCAWVMYVSSLTSPFPILFLTSPCLFHTYQLYLIPAPSPPPLLPQPLPADNPPNDLHIYDSVSVLVLCLVPFFRFSCQ